MTGRRAIAAGMLAAAAPVALAFAVAIALFGTGALTPAAASPGLCSSAPAQAGVPVAGVSLDSAQLGNARVIYDVSVSMDLPHQAAVIAIATAMQESTLRNLGYGDRDSLGLFQQRPSQGWGTPAQIMNPVYASTAFYNALVQVPGWQSLPLTVAAQDVQHSAYPDAYAQWQPLATALVTTFSGTAGTCPGTDGRGVPARGTTRIPHGYRIPLRVPPQVKIAVAYALAQLGKPYIWGGTGPAGFDCSGLVMIAYRAAGIELPRTTYQQVLTGTPVYALSDAQAGDLLFTAGADGTASSPGHVGLYLGSGLVIDAPQTGEPVMITPLAPYWEQNTVAIRQIA
jgi:cell wall-associated NlpC family hydrolase